ncbi:hypothetical protein BC829DRAFT_180134 [Chytridium lagenaria]|nr:hypothetical protein BC829DRAFT_180134 [Chytridium lagenaria]
MLSTSFQHLPEPNDSERPKYYFPQNPYPTPSYFPDTPLAVLRTPPFLKCSTSTHCSLSFTTSKEHINSKTPRLPCTIFLTTFRYLAARELKKHAWRFHQKVPNVVPATR